MKDADWLDKDDKALEHLLVERWLYRGGMLAVMLLSAITSTYLGIQGVTTLSDMITVGALLALGVTAAGIAFVMRLADLRIHRELRRRRSR
jgi:arginine exporter protein ArgO